METESIITYKNSKKEGKRVPFISPLEDTPSLKC
jgi:hypothetical protein